MQSDINAVLCKYFVIITSEYVLKSSILQDYTSLNGFNCIVLDPATEVKLRLQSQTCAINWQIPYRVQYLRCFDLFLKKIVRILIFSNFCVLYTSIGCLSFEAGVNIAIDIFLHLLFSK